MKPCRLLLITLAAFAVAVPLALADATPADEPALRGLIQAKVVADINVGAGRLTTRLQHTDETYRQLRDAGVHPLMVLVFRGAASRLLARSGTVALTPAELLEKKQIDRWIDRFRESGLRMEQCGIAARAQGLQPEDFPLGIVVVRNGYVSLVGYQNQGYALLPMD